MENMDNGVVFIPTEEFMSVIPYISNMKRDVDDFSERMKAYVRVISDSKGGC